MHRMAITTLVFFLAYSYSLPAQVLEKTLKAYESMKQFSYVSIIKEKDPFSGTIRTDSVRAVFFMESAKRPSFQIKSYSQEEVVKENQLICLNFSDSTYRITPAVEESVLYYKSLPFIMEGVKALIKKHLPVQQLKDSIIDHKPFAHLSIVELDSISNTKRIYKSVTLLVDKETNLPYYIKVENQGFIDGTDLYVELYSAYYFEGYTIHQQTLPDLALWQVPAYFTLETTKAALPLLPEGSKAPEIDLLDSLGQAFRLQNQQGRIVLLNFTSSNCPHGVESIASLNRLYTHYKGAGFLLVTIHPLDSRETVLLHNSRFRVCYPLFINPDQGSRNVLNYHIDTYPTFYVVDKNGRIAKGFQGYYPGLEKELTTLIDQLKR